MDFSLDDSLLVLSEFLLEAFIDVDNGSSLFEDLIGLFEVEGELVHNKTAEHGCAAGHTSFAMY